MNHKTFVKSSTYRDD